jgi:phytoene dehydrogenase-like protein
MTVTHRSVMTLFSAPDCVFSHRARVVLAEKDIQSAISYVDPDDPPEDLRDLNPYSSLPTLVDRDLVLYDSRVIMEYLDERFPHPPLMPVDPVVFAPLPDGNHLTLWQDIGKTAAELGRFSAQDEATFSQYSQTVARYAAFIETALARTPPDMEELDVTDIMSWLPVGKDFWGLGNQDMYGLLRVLPMSVEEFLCQWFESDVVKGVLGASGITCIQQGPFSGGTAYVLFHHHLGHRQGGLPSTGFVYGGIGKLALALASAAQQLGATIRVDAPVAEIKVKNGRATGVVLDSGEEIGADLVVSGTNPRHTFTELVDPAQLDPGFLRAVDNIKFRGAVAKVNLALSGLPAFTALPNGDTGYSRGRIQTSPSLAHHASYTHSRPHET